MPTMVHGYITVGFLVFASRTGMGEEHEAVASLQI
jgi:hypothetical protein